MGASTQPTRSSAARARGSGHVRGRGNAPRHRSRRTTTLARPEDGREQLARALSQLQDIQAAYLQFRQRLQRQYDALNRICHNDRASFSQRMQARQMAHGTQTYLNVGAPLGGILDQLLLNARRRLASVREIDGVAARHMAHGPLVEQAQAEADTVQQTLNQYRWDAMLAANQDFVDAHQDLATGPGANAACGGPDSGSAFHAWAATQGLPEGVTNYQTAYRSGWDTHARLFQFGTPVDGDRHRRRFAFADVAGSYVEIQAHQPLSLHNQTSQTHQRAWVLAAAAAVAGLAVALGGPVGAVVRAALGAVLGAIVSVLAVQQDGPRDVAWQGYTARFYASADADVGAPWGTQYFYGLKRASVPLDGRFDPDQGSNFADQPDVFSWWTWHVGAADVRAPERLHPHDTAQPESQGIALISAQVNAQVAALVQSMAQLGVPTQSLQTWAQAQRGDGSSALLAAAR